MISELFRAVSTRSCAVLTVRDLTWAALVFLVTLAVLGCPGPDDDPIGGEGEGEGVARRDDAMPLSISASVNQSFQNPAFSPDGSQILLTRFNRGYNSGFDQENGTADVLVLDLDTKDVRVLVSDGSINVNLPGSAWNDPTGRITFSSDRGEHDEIYIIDETGAPGEEIQVTSRPALQAFEPSFSPDGSWIVFETHEIDVEDGVIERIMVEANEAPVPLTDAMEVIKQPNWAPTGDLIAFQRFENDRWDLWVMNTDGSDPRKVTEGPGDKTDVSFSPDGEWLVYSSDEGSLANAEIFIVPVFGGTSVRVTDFEGYDGAPSWSPDGTTVVFESSPGDPDGSPGTTLWMINTPREYFESDG